MTRRTFLEEVAAERARELAANGFSYAIDDGCAKGEIARAAAEFAAPEPSPATSEWATLKRMMPRRRQLVVAAAYCMVEAERLERAEGIFP